VTCSANNYQKEESELWIGEWMKKRGNRDQMVIATKYTTAYRTGHGDKEILANTGGNGTKSLHTSLEASLKKLQTTYIDILYVHWWDWTTSISKLMQSLNHQVALGRVLYLGASDLPAWVVSKANEYARSHGLRGFSVYQGNWSAEKREFERDIIPMCVAEGMGIAPWGALGGGNFKTEEQRASSEGRNMTALGRPVPESAIKVSKVLENIAKKKNTQITSVALAYVMHKTPYVFPIVGGRKIEHLKGNIEALSLELTDEDMKEIEATVPFDIGFPMSMVGTEPTNTWVVSMAGHFDYVKGSQVCLFIFWCSIVLLILLLILDHSLSRDTKD
jgi:aryl-alcohol dehydrogenase-like predicted oxidoreductase